MRHNVLLFALISLLLIPITTAFTYPEFVYDSQTTYAPVDCIENRVRGPVYTRTIEMPNTKVIEYYDLLGRCRLIEYYDSMKGLKYTDRFTYEEKSVKGLRDNQQVSYEITYDSENRLTYYKASGSPGLVLLKKSYDRNGDLAAETLQFANEEQNIRRELGYRKVLIRIVTKNQSGKEIERWILKYNKNQEPIMVAVSGEGRKKKFVIESAYTDSGLTAELRKIGKSEDGDSVQLQKISIARDDYGNILTKTVSSSTGTSGSERTMWQYSYEFW